MKHISIYMLSLLAIIAVASCSSDDDYTPAQPVDADNWGVYFDSNNKSEYIREPEDDATIRITIKRDRTDGELTVPLQHSHVVGEINAPTEVKFGNGEGEKTLTITYAGFPEVKPSIILTIPEEYVNPYKEKEGFYKQLIAVKKAEIVTNPFSIYDDDWTTENIFSKSESVIKWIVGENKFIYTNFFGSGIDLLFRFDTDHGAKFNKNDLSKCYGPIDPLSNAIIEISSGNDGSYGGWTLTYDEKPNKDSEAATWTPEGSKTGVTDYLYFWTYSGDPSDAGSYGWLEIYLYQEDYGYGYSWFSSSVMDDGDYKNYIGCYIYLLDEYKK